MNKKISLRTKIENTMACKAFAEAGEPCTIDIGQSLVVISPLGTVSTENII